MAKSADAFRTISEVADWLDLPTHVLRFWESKFSQVKPVKRAGGRRYYRPNDMRLLGGIKKLLHDDGMTIKGAQKVLREQGAKYVSGLSQPVDEDEHDLTVETPVQEHKDDVEFATTAPEASNKELARETSAIETAPENELNIVEEDAASHEDSAVVSFPTRTVEEEVGEEVSSAEDASSPEDASATVADENTAAQDEPASIASEPTKSPAPASLPSFLKSDKQEPSEKEQTADLEVRTPDDPSDTSVDADAGILSRLAASKTRFSPEVLSALVEAQSELKALVANN